MDSRTQELMDIILQGETLKVEFKSDLKQLSDRELVATVMNLSNSEGGDLLLGVEDDGSITGLHPNHLNTMGIVALIANKTNPPVSVKIETYDIDDKKVARIRVPKSRQLVSTSEGLLQRRRLMANGKPEAVPFYPHEFIQRQSALGLTDVRMNEFFRKPLLQVFEEVERLFAARAMEKELEFGLFRVPVPNFDKRAFREAFVNALVHRDYARLGAIHVQIDDNGLSVSNPGGFVEGVTLDNLLVTKPHPRNPLLADMSKRFGLSERTGRGIDRIYEGLLRYGRPEPDYSSSNASSVVVQMSNAESDTAFLEMILHEEKRIGHPLPLDTLIILSRLREERRLTTADLTHSTQKSEQATRVILEKLVESGLIEAHGNGRARTYTLSAKLYQKTDQKAGYVRQTGFDPIQQEQMILSYIKEHKTIQRTEAADLCRISPFQAKRLLKKMVIENKLIVKGRGRGTFYEFKS